MPKLNVSIFQFPLGKCTNGPSTHQKGATAHFKQEASSNGDTAVGYSWDEARTIVKDKTAYPAGDYIIVSDICCSKIRRRAIECATLRSDVWTMMGGNFMETSDSRWFDHPIDIHDRVEGFNGSCGPADHPYWTECPDGPQRNGFDGEEKYDAIKFLLECEEVVAFIEDVRPSVLQKLRKAVR